MKQQTVFVAPNNIKVVVDKNSNPENVQLFSKVKVTESAVIGTGNQGQIFPWMQHKAENGGRKCRFCGDGSRSVKRGNEERGDEVYRQCLSCGATGIEQSAGVFEWYQNLAQAGVALGF